MANIIQAGITIVRAHLAQLNETDRHREDRLDRQHLFTVIKVAGIAITVIAGIAALYIAMHGMLLTALLDIGVCVLAADVARVGVNGVNMSSTPETQLLTIFATILRHPELWNCRGTELMSPAIDAVLMEGTLVIHHLIKPSEWL